MSAQLKTFHGACPHDCPDTCSFVYTVENDRLVSVKGNADHPMTNGGLCVKLKDYDERHYNADRVLFPLKRNGPKGSRQYVRITWESALAEIRQRWTEIIARHGSQAILPLSYLGNQGLVHGITAGDAFFNRLGATVCEKTFCASGSSTAWLITVGPTGGVDPESFVHAKYIVIWGCNTLSTNLHHWPFVRRAQENGAKIVVIDAYKSLTAKKADWHIAPKPGTDGALAMAWVNVLISENLLDNDYIGKYTVGFDELKERALKCTPEWAEQITGIKADDIRKLAREYATVKPAAIRVGVGLERSAGGADAIRLAAILPALIGAWRHVGGGTLEMPVWEFPIHWDRVCRPDWIPDGTQVVNILQTGRALVGELPLKTPIMSLFVYNTNPVTQAPESDKTLAGLRRDDLFTVVADQFMSDTASYADIILPDRTVDSMLELDLGGKTLRLTAYPTAHTHSDLSVLDVDTGTLWLGDLLFRERLPSFDGSVLGWLKVIGTLEQEQGVRTVIPGHGPVGEELKAALADEKRYMETVVAEVRAQIADGKDIDEAVETVGLSERGRWQLWDQQHKRNVSRAYTELEWE